MIGSAAAVLLAAGSLHSIGFHTPSGNIRCDSFKSDKPYPAFLRCDIRDQYNPRPRKPRRCEFDFGGSYGVTTTARRGMTLCVSDAVVDTRPVLHYGQRWSRNGFTCDSHTYGLTCRNGKGHGFFLSKQSQRLF